MTNKSVFTLLFAGVLAALILSGCSNSSYIPLNREEPAVSIEPEKAILQLGLGTYGYYDVNRHSLRWLMAENDLKEVFKNDSLAYEEEFGDGQTQLKSLSFDLKLSPPSIIAGQISTRVDFTLIKIDNVYRLISATYFYNLWTRNREEADDAYSAVLNELTAQFGQPHHHFETDFSDIVPDTVFRTLLHYTTDRWHLGHNMIDLFMEICINEDVNSTDPAYFATIFEQYSLFIAGQSDIAYDRVSEDNIFLPSVGLMKQLTLYNPLYPAI